MSQITKSKTDRNWTHTAWWMAHVCQYRSMVNDVSLFRNFFESINTYDPQERPTDHRLNFEEAISANSDMGDTFTAKSEKQLQEDASLKDFWASLRKLGDGNLSIKNVGVM